MVIGADTRKDHYGCILRTSRTFVESWAGTQGPGMRVDGLIRGTDLCAGMMEERRKVRCGWDLGEE